MKTRTIDGVRITCQMPATLSRKVSRCGADFTPGGSSVTISQTSTPIRAAQAPTPRNVIRQPTLAVA